MLFIIVFCRNSIDFRYVEKRNEYMFMYMIVYKCLDYFVENKVSLLSYFRFAGIIRK